MTRILLSISCVMALVCQVLNGSLAAATTADLAAVRLSLVQAAGSDVKYERIDITNYGDQAADVTGWRLVYVTASGATKTPLAQITASANWHVLLGPAKTESLLSKELVSSTPVGSPLRQGLQFTAALNHTAGSVQLLDADGRVIDMIGWGSTATEAVRQGQAAPAMTTTTWLKRQALTGNNATDFALEAQSINYSAMTGLLTEVLDVCPNIADIQEAVPGGYMLMSDGACQPVDVCPNLLDIQLAVPNGMELDSVGECRPIDVCRNMDGIQTEVAAGYELTAPGVCELQLPVRSVFITELLPNPSGADAGNEFIELYNADSEPTELDNYRLVIGDKQYKFPTGTVIPPGTYWTVSDTELGVTLANTTGPPVYLLTVRGVEVAQSPAYKNAPDDASWAMIDGRWQYSYVPTPGAANVAMSEPPCQAGYERDGATGRCRKPLAPAQVAACSDGQYRSESTGRCRAVAAVAVLAPCKDGQYRSEATNRCRSLTSASVVTQKPCADDQFRNPLTNRCKAIASSEEVALADCGEGRERNPDTHRCRNIVTANIPAAAFAPAPVNEVAKGFVGWWALGGVGLLAGGYGVWEWRREIAAIAHRVASVVRSK